MEQLGFQGGSTGASALSEVVQVVLKLNLQREATIQYPCHGLPEDLNQTNYAKVTITLWDKGEGLPSALILKDTLMEICMDQANNHIPFIRIRRLLPSFRPHPGPNMFHLHSG